MIHTTKSGALGQNSRVPQVFIAAQDQVDYVITNFTLTDNNYMAFLDDVHCSFITRAGQTLTLAILPNAGSILKVYCLQ